jgi:hypothetical protein
MLLMLLMLLMGLLLEKMVLSLSLLLRIHRCLSRSRANVGGRSLARRCSPMKTASDTPTDGLPHLQLGRTRGGHNGNVGWQDTAGGLHLLERSLHPRDDRGINTRRAHDTASSGSLGEDRQRCARV